MICIGCGIDEKNFQINMLANDSRHSKCSNCIDLKNAIDTFQKESYFIYNMELRRKFFEIFPLYTGNEIVIIKPEVFNIQGFDEYKILKDIFENLNILDTQYSDRTDINNICDQIMAQLIHQLNHYVSQNPQGYLFSFLGMLEYNFYVTGICMMWSANQISSDYIETIHDNFARDMARSLEFQKIYDFNGSYKGLYKEWESRLSLDKYAIQYGIELIHQLIKKSPQRNEAFNDHIFGTITSLIRGIYSLIYARETSIENLKKGVALIIDEDGKLYTTYNIDHDKFSTLYVESMQNKLTKKISLEDQRIYDEKCLKYLGVTLSEIGESPVILMSFFNRGDEFLVGDKSYFEILLSKIFNRSKSELTKLLDYFLNKGEGFEYARSTKVRPNKVLNRSLLLIENELICCTVQFFAISLDTLYIDIVEGNIPDSPLKRELSKIVNESQDTEFENQVSKMISDFFPEAKVKVNVSKEKEVPILGESKFISFYGEIDILVYYSENLFVIECKNKSLKTNVKTLNNDLNSFTKSGKDSFQYKLDQKIKDVLCNWTSILAYLGVPNYNNILVKQPIGVFVTSSLTLATLERTSNPVIPASHIIKWINESISN